MALRSTSASYASQTPSSQSEYTRIDPDSKRRNHDATGFVKAVDPRIMRRLSCLIGTIAFGTAGMSISTKKGDCGTTGLIGGTRVSKADGRVEAYGTIDELGAAIGFARSITDDAEVVELARTIQRELFSVGAAIATDPEARKKGDEPVTPEMVAALGAHVDRIEAIDGILGDWAIPGEHSAAAAFDIARTVCRRAERHIVRLNEGGAPVSGNVLAYINRLSDLLWLLGRLLEVRAGIDSTLRKGGGPKWSKAW